MESIQKPKTLRLHLDSYGLPIGSGSSKTPYHFAAAFGLCLAFLVLLPTRSTFRHGHDASFPRLALPHASHGGRMPCNGTGAEILSWKPDGCWISASKGEIRPENLQAYLTNVADRYANTRTCPQIKVRTARNEPAKHFIQLVHCMENAGLTQLHISVFLPKATPL